MTDAAFDQSPAAAPAPAEATARDFVLLLKPRVMSLVIFTALVGMLAAPGAVNPLVGFASLLCIAVGAGAAGALNMWWDADIDAVMKRTKGRPIPAGRVSPDEALGFGLGLSVLSVMMLALFANPAAAALLAFTIFFYAVIYSMWLKRATPQNIVIGGAAGAFPPLVGWMAVTGSASLEPVLMFALIFMWTPPHFWALALFAEIDYQKAGVPMLPNVAGAAATRRQIWWYSLGLAAVALLPAFTSVGGPVYLAVALWLNLRFLRGAWAILGRSEAEAQADKFRAEKKFFGLSILYLFAHFAALGVEALLRLAFGPYAAPMAFL